jgi:tetratricopeptide (TPR) repeat protein/2-polyprenyl-3-methyl-5-hydroxy-6-metoxy-1,4-benzoquinol methylase
MEARPPSDLAPALAYRDAGDYAKAESWLADYLAARPNDAEALAHLAHMQMRLRRDAAAHATLTRAEAIAPGNALVLRNRAMLALRAQRIDLAAAAAARALAADPGDPESRLVQALVLAAHGSLDRALQTLNAVLDESPDFAEALANRAMLHRQSGDPMAAIADAQRALALKPHIAPLWRLLAGLHAQAMRKDEAIAALRRYVELEPDDAAALAEFGGLLAQDNRGEEAIAVLTRAVAVAPGLAEAWFALGHALQRAGRLDEAVAAYHKALAANPGMAEAHLNLGAVLQARHKVDEAVTQYRRVIALKPDLIQAYLNLAMLLIARGERTEALGIVTRALGIKETVEAKALFVQCVKGLPPDQLSAAIRGKIVRALSEPWSRPIELAEIGAALIKQNPIVADAIARATKAWPSLLPATELFGPSGLAAAAGDPVLRCLLESAPIPDIDLERFLTGARSALLEIAGAAGDIGDQSSIGFFCVLARQCFINEYVFACSDREAEQVRHLSDEVSAALASGAPVRALSLAAVGAYVPLASLAGADSLTDRPWPAAIEALLRQQIEEPREEAGDRAALPRLTAIDDEVSRMVMQQYEENPFPRWTKVAPAGTPVPIDRYLQARFPAVFFRHLGKESKVELLVAGCGTGQHAIETAQQFAGVEVLAIDLSLASLGYAQRQTRRLGLSNIQYGQADILRLDSLGRRFDIVESVGVLHHLADPMAGWRVLLSILRPGGFMRLGFYSERARQDVVAARAFVAARGYRPVVADIRRFRQDMAGAERSDLWESILKRSDFFSTSECRDLLFHVQEHRLNLPVIAAFLRDHDVAFLGFEVAAPVSEHYRARFPDDRSLTDLARWHQFEIDNPDTFAGMYQFWVQKKP